MNLLEQLFKTKNKKKSVSDYSLTYNIGEWLPNQKYYAYDRMLSLENYLIRTDIPKFERIKIMGAEYPFDAFNAVIMNLDGSDMRYVFDRQIDSYKKRVVLWAINECDIYGTSENICMYLLYRIGQIFQWDMFKSVSMNQKGQETLLNACSADDYKGVVGLFDADVLNAFAFVHSKSNVDLSEAIRYGLDFLANNSKSSNSGHGSLYNAIGKSNIEAIIYKVFEARYNLVGFDYSNIFYKTPTTKKASNQKNTEIMYPFGVEQLRYCGNQIVDKKPESFYYLSSNQKAKCEEYLELLKEAWVQSKKIKSSVKIPKYESAKLSFTQGHVNGVINSSLFFVHPLTATEKVSKFPSSISLRFGKDDKLNINRMYFDKNASARRLELYYQQYSIIAKIEKSGVQIAYIYKVDDYGKKVKLYP